MPGGIEEAEVAEPEPPAQSDPTGRWTRVRGPGLASCICTPHTSHIKQSLSLLSLSAQRGQKSISPYDLMDFRHDRNSPDADKSSLGQRSLQSRFQGI